jgi:elongation factor Ts
MVNIEDLKKLRTESQAGIADCRRALEETNGDYKKATEWLKKHGIEKAEKKQDRQTSQGIIEAYTHLGKVGVLIVLLCETDFVAKTDEFKKLAHEIAMQIAAMEPKDVASLLKQVYIRDNSITIEQLVKSVIGKLGENITIKSFSRLEV